MLIAVNFSFYEDTFINLKDTYRPLKAALLGLNIFTNVEGLVLRI